MSKDLKLPNQSEEVDLGQLFKLIGNAFDRLFKFIGNIFKQIFHIILLLLIHFYKQIKWYALAIVVGVATGFYLDMNSQDIYGANLYIETNYKSTRQVYEIMKNLDQLTVDRDTLELSKRLEITPFQAKNLKGFYVEPDIDENVLIKMFVDYKTGLDSVAKESITYKEYVSSLSAYGYGIHKIGVASTDKFIYAALKDQLIAEFRNNEYLSELKTAGLVNLDIQEKAINEEMKVLDSLKKDYLKIRIKESNKEVPIGSGTNFFMGNAGKNELIKDETAIIDRIYNLENKKLQINTARVTDKNLVNVISNFPDSGYDISEWYDKMKFVLPIIFFGITFLGFLAYSIGNYLADQDKKLKKV